MKLPVKVTLTNDIDEMRIEVLRDTPLKVIEAVVEALNAEIYTRIVIEEYKEGQR